LLLIVGLGNPGARYEATRHNAGFMLIDRMAGARPHRFTRTGSSLWTKSTVAGRAAVLAKPQTFMNLSGEAVIELIEAFGVDAGDMTVAYDDLDLPFGRIRLKRGGGSGGHRGIESIIQCLGTREFNRLRLGIGRPSPPSSEDTVSYVLSPFSPDQSHGLARMLEAGASSMETLAAEGIDAAMNRHNSATIPYG